MIEEMSDESTPTPQWVQLHRIWGEIDQGEREGIVIGWELFQLVGEGLLEWSIDPITEEAIFWPTPKGAEVLGMREVEVLGSN